jgi:hypothetical protein
VVAAKLAVQSAVQLEETSSKQQDASEKHLLHSPIEQQYRSFSHFPAARPVLLAFLQMKCPFFPITILRPKNSKELGS